jgi:hypothetical protein
VDGDAVRVARASQFWGIGSPFNVGDLGGGKSNYFVSLVVPKVDVKVMEVTSSSSHDKNSVFLH